MKNSGKYFFFIVFLELFFLHIKAQNTTITIDVNGVLLEMVEIKGATYKRVNQLGDTMFHHQPTTIIINGTTENGSSTIILSDYYIGKYEVTQDLYEAVMGKNKNHSYYPYNFSSNKAARDVVAKEGPAKRFPVDCISWQDAQTFVDSINALTGLHFRLPTEAEWEYAASGGTFKYRYSGSDTLENVAWGWENGSQRSHAVGLLQPNEFGLYDMSGNVAEWCSDWFSSYYYRNNGVYRNPKGPKTGQLKILKGGSWGIPNDNSAEYLTRIGSQLNSNFDTGFRLVLDEYNK